VCVCLKGGSDQGGDSFLHVVSVIVKLQYISFK
jgi:hypothetical protein